MSRTKKPRKRSSQARNPKYHIAPQDTTTTRRKLRLSARIKLARQRARRRWICPWINEVTFRVGCTGYAEASLLGLPPELRGMIWREVVSGDLLGRESGDESGKERKNKRRVKEEEEHADITHKQALLEKRLQTHLTLAQHAHFAALKRQMDDLKCVAPLLRCDMAVVWQPLYAEWKACLELPTMMAPEGISIPPTTAVASRKGQGRRRKGTLVLGKERGGKTRRRRCWRCDERHWGGDLVCPRARRDPEGWERLSKVVKGGKRGKERVCGSESTLFRGTRIVFGDD